MSLPNNSFLFLGALLSLILIFLKIVGVTPMEWIIAWSPLFWGLMINTLIGGYIYTRA